LIISSTRIAGLLPNHGVPGISPKARAGRVVEGLLSDCPRELVARKRRSRVIIPGLMSR
jgi:hypothetical protein